ncbi:hypothetical protein HN446_00780 [bacterium]|jgi:hypothetical protein|nr:hypothetical protein [bacterium]
MKKKLRVGLLLDSFYVDAWQYRMIEQVINQGCSNIVLAVINAKSKSKKTIISELRKKSHKIIYFLYSRFDRLFFKQSPDAFAKKNLKELISDVSVINVVPEQKKFADYINETDLKTIKESEVDILVRIGFRILKGEILTIARYGVWSYHHGDNKKNRGGPPGFWETVYNWDVTGCILQILNETLDGGIVIYRSYSRTDKVSVERNKNNYFWKSASFLSRAIRRLHLLGEEEFFEQVKSINNGLDFYSGKIFKTPKNLHALYVVAKQAYKIIGWAISKILFVNQWFLLFLLGKKESLGFYKFKKIIPPKDRFWADPFVVEKDEKYFVFIEEFPYRTNKGHISVFDMTTKGAYTRPIKVLERPYHLSYPFVFWHDKKFYMVPESNDNNTIELYECVDFPYKWEHKTNLMEGVSAADTTLFFYEKKWWLFTAIEENQGSNHDDELFLYYSDSLFSKNWVSHPANPVVSDVRSARPAGKIFERDGILYRPSQDCSKCYGYGLNMNKITVLTEKKYEEKMVSYAHPKWSTEALGVHSFTYEKGLTMIDAFRRRLRIF